MKKTLLIALLLAWISPAAAAPTWHTAKIRSIYPQANGTDFVITFETDSPTCTNASNPKYYYARVGENGMTLDGVKHILSAALTAAAAGKTVSINFDNSSSGCFINRLAVDFAS